MSVRNPFLYSIKQKKLIIVRKDEQIIKLKGNYHAFYDVNQNIFDYLSSLPNPSTRLTFPFGSSHSFHFSKYLFLANIFKLVNELIYFIICLNYSILLDSDNIIWPFMSFSTSAALIISHLDKNYLFIFFIFS